jgi:hypothetical protein
MAHWREQLDGLAVEDRVKALLCFELASDRVGGRPVDVTSRALRAVVQAEGLDTAHSWIDAAAEEISRGSGEAPPEAVRTAT